MIGNVASLPSRGLFGLTDVGDLGATRVGQEKRAEALTAPPAREWKIPTREGNLVVRAEAPPQWFVGTLGSMIKLLQLEDNWDSYGARRIQPRTILLGLDLLAATMREDTPAPLVVPAPRGGIQLEWHAPALDIEVEVLPDGLLKFYVEDAERQEQTELEEGAGVVRQHLSGALSRLGNRA